MRTPFIALILVAFVFISVWSLFSERLLPEGEMQVVTPVACTLEARICPDGSSVERTGPSCEFRECPEMSKETGPIIVDYPTEDALVSSPFSITGKARGFWFFEGSFPISVVNWDGLIIGEGIATAQGDWMTENYAPFTATISYTFDPKTPYNRGTVILKKDNPSGLPEHDAAYEIPILFDTGEHKTPLSPEESDAVPLCTMDAMECPDGSYVERIPPLCAFAPCPGKLEVQ